MTKPSDPNFFTELITRLEDVLTCSPHPRLADLLAWARAQHDQLTYPPPDASPVTANGEIDRYL